MEETRLLRFLLFLVVPPPPRATFPGAITLHIHTHICTTHHLCVKKMKKKPHTHTPRHQKARLLNIYIPTYISHYYRKLKRPLKEKKPANLADREDEEDVLREKLKTEKRAFFVCRFHFSFSSRIIKRKYPSNRVCVA